MCKLTVSCGKRGEEPIRYELSQLERTSAFCVGVGRRSAAAGRTPTQDGQLGAAPPPQIPPHNFSKVIFICKIQKKISVRKSDSINKWRETDTLLLHATNRKYHMAYPCRQKTLENLEGHLPNAGLIKCNSTNICATFSTVLTDMARRAVPRR